MSRYFPMDPHERHLREQGEIMDCERCGKSLPANNLDENFLCAKCAEEKEENNES